MRKSGVKTSKSSTISKVIPSTDEIQITILNETPSRGNFIPDEEEIQNEDSGGRGGGRSSGHKRVHGECDDDNDDDDNNDNNDSSHDDDDDDDLPKQPLENDIELLYDDQGILKIPKSNMISHETEDISTLKGKSTLAENLFSYLCVVAYDAVDKKVTLPTEDLQISIADNFSSAIETHLLKAEVISGIMQPFIKYDNTLTWPSSFLDFVKTQKSKKIPDKFKNGLLAKRWTDHQVKQCFFGSIILRRAKETFSYVNTKLNPHWPDLDKFKSGSSPYALLRVIRKHLWSEAAESRGSAALRQYLTSRPGLSNKEKERLLQLKIASAYKKLNYDWYPKYWLAFVYKGKAANFFNEDHQSPDMNSGKIISSKPTGVYSPIAEIGNMSSAVRRNRDKMSANLDDQQSNYYYYAYHTSVASTYVANIISYLTDLTIYYIFIILIL